MDYCQLVFCPPGGEPRSIQEGRNEASERRKDHQSAVIDNGLLSIDDCQLVFCAPGGTRTPNHLIRSQVLYPIELQARGIANFCRLGSSLNGDRTRI